MSISRLHPRHGRVHLVERVTSICRFFPSFPSSFPFSLYLSLFFFSFLFSQRGAGSRRLGMVRLKIREEGGEMRRVFLLFRIIIFENWYKM